MLRQKFLGRRKEDEIVDGPSEAVAFVWCEDVFDGKSTITQRDDELLEKMRERLHHHVCPKCKQVLVAKTENGVHVHACPDGHGAWLDEPALKAVLKEHK